MILPEKRRLAIFDCDGTLVDSQHSILTCMNHAFSAANRQPPPLAEVRRVVGLPLAVAIAKLCEDIPAEAGEVDRMAAAYSEAWQAHRHGNNLDEPLYDGILELLKHLQATEWLLGVATGKSMRGLQATLLTHGLDEFFVTLQTSDIAKGKPHPDMIERALLETDVEREDAVMIGDTTFDIEMAGAAKVRAIGVDWGYHDPHELVASGAEAVVSTADALRDQIEVHKETTG